MSDEQTRVVIGMDPHQRSVTIEVMTADETVLAGGRFGTDGEGYRQLFAYVAGWPARVWAIEGCRGIGRHIAHRLLADGEQVVDVPPKLSARVRVFATGQGRKTDATDAHSIDLTLGADAPRRTRISPILVSKSPRRSSVSSPNRRVSAGQSHSWTPIILIGNNWGTSTGASPAPGAQPDTGADLRWHVACTTQGPSQGGGRESGLLPEVRVPVRRGARGTRAPNFPLWVRMNVGARPRAIAFSGPTLHPGPDGSGTAQRGCGANDRRRILRSGPKSAGVVLR